MITARLAAHVAETPFEALPPEAVSAAKRSLLDAVGVSLAASGLGEGCAAFADQARAFGGGDCTVLGFGFKAPPLMAAFANGALAHALDFEDAYDGAPIHPNAAGVPAALAITESADGVSGRELVCALALGCDVVCRLGLALTRNPDDYGFYPPPLLGAFGATAAAGRLLRLDSARMSEAFALTLCQATASAQFKTSPRSQVRGVRDAFAAQAGVQAAQLAARGVAAFNEAFEGKAGFYALYARGAYAPERVLDGLGERFEGAGVSFKPWPACRGTHAFIEAALGMGVKADEVAGVTFAGDPAMRMLFEPFSQKAAPVTAIDAKFSLPFTVASALVNGKVDLMSYAPEALTDAAVLSLAARSAYRDEAGTMTRGTLEVALADGRMLRRTIDHPKGHPSSPMTDEELAAKFFDCAGHAAKPAVRKRLERFADEVFRLERLGDVSRLTAGL